MKFCDMKNMKSEEISTEILPPLKCNTLKHPFGLVSHRARECIYCQECNKPRIIWVERKAPGLEKYIDNLVTTMIFTCGTKLNENDYGCYINVQINCESPINQNYFKKLLGDIVCYKCGTELDSDDVRKYHDEIPTFTSISQGLNHPRNLKPNLRRSEKLAPSQKTRSLLRGRNLQW